MKIYWLQLPPTWRRALPSCGENPCVPDVWDTSGTVSHLKLPALWDLLCTVSEDVERFIVPFFAWLLPYEWPCFRRPDTGLAIKPLAYTHTHINTYVLWWGIAGRERTGCLNIYKWVTVAIQLKGAHTDALGGVRDAGHRPRLCVCASISICQWRPGLTRSV